MRDDIVLDCDVSMQECPSEEVGFDCDFPVPLWLNRHRYWFYVKDFTDSGFKRIRCYISGLNWFELDFAYHCVDAWVHPYADSECSELRKVVLVEIVLYCAPKVGHNLKVNEKE